MRNNRFNEKVISENIISSAQLSQFRKEKISVSSTNTKNVVLIATVKRVLFYKKETSFLRNELREYDDKLKLFQLVSIENYENLISRSVI